MMDEIVEQPDGYSWYCMDCISHLVNELGGIPVNKVDSDSAEMVDSEWFDKDHEGWTTCISPSNRRDQLRVSRW